MSSLESGSSSRSSCFNAIDQAAFQYKPIKKYDAFEYLKTNQLHGTKLNYSIDPTKNNNISMTNVEKQKMIMF